MGEKRRGAGEGSIYRRKDGRWVGQYEAEGKRRYVYGQDREGVRTRLTKAIADRDAGLVFDSRNLTVSEYVPLWLDSIEGAVGPRTWKRHEELTRLHVIPRLGSARLDKLNALQVQALYRKKLDAGLSPTTVRKIHATLYKALKQAVRWQLVPRNVCDSVTPPRATKVEIEALTREEVKRLLDTAKSDGLFALYVLACTTGMRQGEILHYTLWRMQLCRKSVMIRSDRMFCRYRRETQGGSWLSTIAGARTRPGSGPNSGGSRTKTSTSGCSSTIRKGARDTGRA